MHNQLPLRPLDTAISLCRRVGEILEVQADPDNRHEAARVSV
jgi:hypothetical protein